VTDAKAVADRIAREGAFLHDVRAEVERVKGEDRKGLKEIYKNL